MKRKIVIAFAAVLILIFGGTYMYNKLTKPNLGPKTAKLYQHGFRLLEEQIGTYIKEYYSGVEKIEFPQSMLPKKGQHSQMSISVQLFMISMEIKLLSVLKLKI